MQISVLQEALAAREVFFSFTDPKISSRVFELGQVGLTFDYLPLSVFQRGNQQRLRLEVERFHGKAALSSKQEGHGRDGRPTADINWAIAFINAPEGSAVVTRRNGNELWWSTFADEAVRDGGDYKYRSTRSGWHHIKATKEQLGILDSWLTARTKATNARKTRNPIDAFHKVVREHSLLPLVVSYGSALELAKRAYSAHQQSGRSKLGVYKDKLFGFASREELADFIMRLHADQQGKCALSGLTMLELDAGRTAVDRDCEVSLDRISSDLGYEQSNLQLVCRFINSWKSTDANEHFKSLLDVVRRSPGPRKPLAAAS
ncbi:hypothetical protein [Piscinibacter gummiphilus]|uniref:Uncharacterized protein n=1 Tax=Piscinibacter gummiphilus TaxID=946333 RepID=A0A1W6LG05_9BURK|nr:hypothetical protein [Piscinibacter gummiphilus]ARN23195.1 hypothetical protein A4W93_26650 [Piscinibacter gummiphilus]ATU67894.1 hypothetical protein CPZ87_26780 [Piscinibacter gummiphilus]GLS97179.1 hypothetical protein GCM10007918_44710 [Piscinibacter gummiphilus]